MIKNIKKNQHKNKYHNAEIDSVKACFTDVQSTLIDKKDDIR